jgi:large subunit ribosomal protein L32
MPVPKKRTSKSKKNMRRSHDRVAAPGMSVCANCGSIKHPHSVCESCGHYRGKQVVEPKSNLGFEDSFQAEA